MGAPRQLPERRIDPEECLKFFEDKVAKAYGAGKALNRSTNFMIDDVIDPAETWAWVVSMLAAIRPGPGRQEARSDRG